MILIRSLASANGADRMPTVEVRRDLEGYRDQWDALVPEGDPPSPFQRAWWLESLAGEHGRFVLVVRGDRLLGGLAVSQRTRWGVARLQLIGADLYPVYCDVLADPGEADVVVDHLRGWLRRHRQCLFDFDGVVGSGLLAQALPPGVRSRRVTGAARVSLDQGYDAYLASRSRNLRSSIRRHRTRLNDQGYTHRVLDPQDPVAALGVLRSVHSQRFAGRSVFLPTFDRFAVAADAGMRAGELAVHALARDDDVLAVEATFQVGDLVASYQAGIDATRSEARGAGTALLASVIEWACDRGHTAFSFLRGEEDYKLRWAGHVDDVHRLTGGQGRGTDQLLRAHRVRSRLQRALPGPRPAREPASRSL